MKHIGKFIFLTVLIVIACSQDDSGDPADLKSEEAELLSLSLAFNGETYATTITGNTVTVAEAFPHGAEAFSVAAINVSPKATVNRTAGEMLTINEGPFSVLVTAEDGITNNNFTLHVEVAEPLTEAELLFTQPTESACDNFATIGLGDIIIENNAWNAGNLPAGSYEQCIYTYESADLQLYGWKWQFPDDARGVNAFPQIIYGWKPWLAQSSTQALPKQISAVNKLKVNYAVEVERNDGDYNLAFDNWINSSASVTPQNIQFEFMIWEDSHQLVPFGDYQRDVTTTNGTYQFYMGEPDWEPAGSNWTYLAFKRIGDRTEGTVDVDELLAYLVSEGIVSEDSYLGSIEFGNEVGNSTGQTMMKRFEVELE